MYVVSIDTLQKNSIIKVIGGDSYENNSVF